MRPHFAVIRSSKQDCQQSSLEVVALLRCDSPDSHLPSIAPSKTGAWLRKASTLLHYSPVHAAAALRNHYRQRGQSRALSINPSAASMLSFRVCATARACIKRVQGWFGISNNLFANTNTRWWELHRPRMFDLRIHITSFSRSVVAEDSRLRFEAVGCFS